MPAWAHRLFRVSPPLAWSGALMLVILAVSLLGLLFDGREIMGAPAWLKPAKFAISTAIYQLSLLWVLSFIAGRPRLVHWAGLVTSSLLSIEVIVIVVQAARGVPSHFNVATSLDKAIFNLMGFAILAVWIVQIIVTLAAFRQRFQDPALAWGIRLGMAISVLGASLAGLMLGPTVDQRASAKATGRITLVGAHTIGAADGGPGMAITKWSRQHGDLRVPHFLGLHALQLLPLLALILPGTLPGHLRRNLVLSAALVYLVLLLMAVRQALQGRPFLS